MDKQQQQQKRQMAGVVVLVLVTLTVQLPAEVDGFSWGQGMLGGLAGFGPRFKQFPPGPVFLPPANLSTRWGDILEEALLRAVDLCKTVRLCNATQVTTEYDSQCSECHPCSCDSACYARGDCCVDKLLRDASHEFVLTSTPRRHQQQQTDPALPSPTSAEAAVTGVPSSSSKTFSCHSTDVTSVLTNHAFMVDSCPVDFQGDPGVVQRCATGGFRESTLVPSHWPVWSPASSTTYRNADCALCHGEDVSQTAPWNLLIQCERSIPLWDTGNRTEVIGRVLDEPDCLLSVSHPEGGHESSAPCWPRGSWYVDACNVTGGRRELDEVLWKACEVFHGEMTLGETTYKNVFCAMCNEEQVEALGECKSQLEFPFFLELNATAFQQASSGEVVVGGDTDADDEEVAQAEERCGCGHDEIYDKYEKDCLPLRCSMTRALHDGQCWPLVANGSGLSYEVAISLTPENVSVILQDTTALKQVARNIRTAFVLQGSSSSGWDVQIDHFRVITHAQKAAKALKIIRFTVHIQFFSLWSEPAVDLEGRLFALTTSLWNISVDGRPKESFRAAPVHVNKKSESSGLFFPEVGELPSPSHDADHSVEYAVDIPDRLIRGSGTHVLQTDTYLPVKEVLRCVRVAFRVPNKTDNGAETTTGSRAVLVVNETSGTVRHVPSDTLIKPELVREGEEEGVYLVCADAIFSDLDVTGMPVVIGSSFTALPNGAVASATSTTVSVAILLLVLLTFLLCPELRTARGKCMIGFVSALLLALMLLEAGTHVEADIASRFCLTLGVSVHFFLLSSFVWILICTFHSFLKATRVMDTSSASSSASRSPVVKRGKGSDRFVRYIGLSLAIPFIIVTAVLVGNFLTRRTSCGSTYLGYGAGICFTSDPWSANLGVVLPSCLVLLAGILLFAIAARRSALSSAAVVADDADALHREKTSSSRRGYWRNFVVHVALSVLMVVTWLVGVLAVVTDVRELLYVFLVLRPALALAVLAAVVCQRRVLDVYRALCCSWKKEDRYAYNHKFTAVNT